MMWKVEARDKDGRVFCSWHQTKAEAQASAACCRGRYPYGNRVRVLQVVDFTQRPPSAL